MKIGRLELRRLAAPSYDSAKPDTSPGVVGSDDSPFKTWMWSEDPNPLFAGRTRYVVFDEMRKSDASVRSALLLRKLPALAAKWRVDPASDSPEDKLVADACAWQLGIGDEDDGPMCQTWAEIQAQAQLKIDFGAMFEEIIWSPEPQWFYDADGDGHLLTSILRLAPRAPRTVQRIETDPATGDISFFEQWLPNAQPIPPEKLISHTMDREDGHWWGTSLLRCMYGPWKLKRELMISAGIGWDRFASGIPIITYTDASQKVQATRIGRELRNHERAYLALEEGQMTAEILNGSGSLADPVPLLSFYCTQIADAALQSFTSLGTSQHGSRAVADVLVEPYFQSIQAETEQMASVYRKKLLRQFVTVNFGADVPTPYLRPGRIGSRDIAVLCTALYDAAQAGLDFTDRATQDAVRGVLDLPDTPELMEPVVPGEGDPPTTIPDEKVPLVPATTGKVALPVAAPAPGGSVHVPAHTRTAPTK